MNTTGFGTQRSVNKPSYFDGRELAAELARDYVSKNIGTARLCASAQFAEDGWIAIVHELDETGGVSRSVALTKQGRRASRTLVVDSAEDSENERVTEVNFLDPSDCFEQTTLPR